MSHERGSYSVFDHTADIGVEVLASTRTALYETAAAALFDLMFESTGSGSGAWTRLEIELEAADQEELLVRWLSELIFVYDTRGLVLEDFEVTRISSTRLRAVVRGREYDERTHVLKTEVKAVTYHELAVDRSEDGWSARFVIDV